MKMKTGDLTFAHRQLRTNHGIGAVTFAIKMNESSAEVAAALCSPKEKNFVKSKGRKIANGRLAAKSKFHFEVDTSGHSNATELKDKVAKSFLSMVQENMFTFTPRWLRKAELVGGK